MSLHRGQRFRLNGVQWRVAWVSDLRAHCIATVRKPVTVNDRRTGLKRTFQAKRTVSIDISPNSAVDLCAELERGR
jgi:hypothetical protein